MPRYIKKDDTKPFIKATLCSVTDDPLQSAPVNLTGCTIKFIMRKIKTSTPKVQRDLSGDELVDLANGQVQVMWQANETNEVGDYYVEFQVTDTDAYITTYWDTRTARQIDRGEKPEHMMISVIDDMGPVT